MFILGLNAFHGDSSAAILHNGELLAAVEEERFNRIKHWAGLPVESIRFCLETAGISLTEVDQIAVSFDPSANQLRRLIYGAKMAFRNPGFVLSRAKRSGRGTNLESELGAAFGLDPTVLNGRIQRVEHHLAHAAHAFYPSPFHEAAVLSLDGMGDLCSAFAAIGGPDGIKTELGRVHYPHSIGYFYNALTIFLGFPNYGDEYKVMGLAPYGKIDRLEVMRTILKPKGDFFELDLSCFTHSRDGISMSWDQGSPQVKAFHSPELEKRLGPAYAPRQVGDERQQNIAASMQAVSEEVIFHVVTRLAERTGLQDLCLGGGVAMNSVAVGKITRLTPFRRVYVPCGAADNGTSIGAALWVWHVKLGRQRHWRLEHGFWGQGVDPAACRAAVEEAKVSSLECDQNNLIKRTIDAIEAGAVVGWFQGREEFGARALGCRSLLADPRRIDMRDIINAKIKFREKFRPFAPSILEEKVAEWFENPEPAPFMERVLPFRKEKMSEVPAVVHVDGSGRLQTVSQKTNPLYHALISEFFRRTGVPILLNTSLNENEPIVHTPQQALSCFLRTKMDAIALGPYWVTKKKVPSGEI